MKPAPQTKDAHDVVRSWKLWAELAQVLRIQATHMDQISDAIRANNFDDVRVALQELVKLVKQRQPVLERLSPAINELMAELFDSGSK